MKIPQDIGLPVDIEAFCREAIKANPGASQAELLNKIMKLSRGKVNPHIAKAYLICVLIGRKPGKLLQADIVHMFKKIKEIAIELK